MKAQYDIPFVSQYSDIGHHEWRARGCGIASLKMVLDYWHAVDPRNWTAPLDGLLMEGISGGAYIEGIGWHHGGIARLAAGHGYRAFNVDLAPKGPDPKTDEDAWAMLLAELERGPVMASVWRSLEPPSGGHIIAVKGWDGELVSVSDPIELTAAEGDKLLALRPFLRLFKRRYIVIHP